MTDLVIVPCGGAKLPRPAPAGELYTGSYHRAAMRAAWAHVGRTGGRVRILSGRYGLVPVDRTLDPYEQRIDRPGAISRVELAAQLDDLLLGLGDRIVALLPRPYLEALRGAMLEAELAVPVVDVLEGTRGMGEQLARFRALYAPTEESTP